MAYTEAGVNSKIKVLPVLLSGGKGSRLWPLSRSSYPKQYLAIDENNNHTLIQNTFLRLSGIKNLLPPLIICNEEQRFIVAEQMRAIGVRPTSILLEPLSKNTAPAIALSALFAIEEFKNTVLLILSADHQILNSKKFQDTINENLFLAQEGRLVTFGVPPNSPVTGYGYIESFKEISEVNKFSNIKRFIEKPSKEIAEKLIRNKNYSWNSGIFLFKPSSIIDELNKFEPEIISLCKKALRTSSKDLNFQRLNKEYFEKCPNLSIDNAVLEKTKLGTVCKLDAGWKDIGSWQSIWEEAKKDKNKNSIKGKIFLKDVENSYIRSENRLVVGLGLRDMVIVETNDAILISNKKSTSGLKELVKELEEKSFKEATLNTKNYRPWGNFVSVINDSTWQVKRLEINPHQSISLQLHNHRSEHWIIVKGIAKVEINERVLSLKENESIYVPKGAKHRLSNQGNQPLILVEVQSGDYLGEDDIVRFEDKYKRGTI